MQNREHSCFFSGAHAVKDSGIALSLVYESGINLPLAEATKKQFDRMVSEGFGELDKSGIAELTFPNRGKKRIIFEFGLKLRRPKTKEDSIPFFDSKRSKRKYPTRNLIRDFLTLAVLQAWQWMLFSHFMKFFISMLAVIGFVPAALAAQEAPKSSSLWQVIETGGVMMYPLAALSILALSLIFVFVFTLRRGSVVTSRYMLAADALLRKKDFLGLLAVSNRHNDAVASVLEKALYFLTNNPGATIVEVREVAMAEGVRLAGLWNQRVSYLADIGSIAPMVGLFGTVLGMIKSFTAVSGEMASSRSLLLSSGVAEALIATAAGLVIGIPAMAAYAFFRGRVQGMVSDLEASSTVLMAQLSIVMTDRIKRD